MTTPQPSPRKPRVPRLRKQLLAVIDNRTTMVCLDCAGQIREADEPFNTLMGTLAAPPFHLHCRSTVSPWVPEMIRQQRDAANAEIQSRPLSEKRKGPGGYEGPLPPPAPAAAAAQVAQPRPEDVPPAPGARLPAVNREVTDWGANLAELGRIERDAPAGDERDQVLERMAREQRFHYRPRIVTNGQLSRLLANNPGAREVWITDLSPNEGGQLRIGGYVPTLTAYGAGYVAVTAEPDESGAVRAAALGEMRIITWEELLSIRKELLSSLTQNQQRRYAVILSDPARLAMALGYDAILLPDGDLLVLNRTALVVTYA